MWEYKTSYYTVNRMPYDRLQVYLNEQGKERWQLVHIITRTLSNNPNDISSYTFFFKRSVE